MTTNMHNEFGRTGEILLTNETVVGCIQWDNWDILWLRIGWCGCRWRNLKIQSVSGNFMFQTKKKNKKKFISHLTTIIRCIVFTFDVCWWWWRWWFWFRSFCYALTLMSILQKRKHFNKCAHNCLNAFEIIWTSKWLFAWIDHSSRFANILPHNSHVHDNGWFVEWFCIEAIFVCWLFVCWLCMPPWCKLFAVDSGCKWPCIRFCLFSLFDDFFFISERFDSFSIIFNGQKIMPFLMC